MRPLRCHSLSDRFVPQISLAAFLAYRFIRFPRFLDFYHMAPLRKSCGGPLELPTDGAITRS